MNILHRMLHPEIVYDGISNTYQELLAYVEPKLKVLNTISISFPIDDIKEGHGEPRPLHQSPRQ